MRILLLGSGGREHALGWKLTASPTPVELISTPGNPGLAELGTVIPNVAITDPAAVLETAVANAVDFVVIGPEAPLAAGVTDALESKGISVFGPSAAAARLESSKAYAKDVMLRSGVPTAGSATFTDLDAALDHLRNSEGPYVVKADGLAGGKGVLVTQDRIAAEGWARLCFSGHFGEAGSTVVIEEHLEGREVSVFAICDGTRAVPLEPARDYKRLLDGDQGPNTGGMGCYSPVPDLPEDLVAWTMRQVVDPVLATLAADGVPYRGFLYTGLMLTDSGPKVLEFNCRLGDPETQVLLPRLEDDLVTLLSTAAAGHLDGRPLAWSRDAAVDVVLAAPGYPEQPEGGGVISGIERAQQDGGVLVFHAGTKRTPEGLMVAGGRVLNVVGIGADVDTARARAYRAAGEIEFEGKQWRSDIGR